MSKNYFYIFLTFKLKFRFKIKRRKYEVKEHFVTQMHRVDIENKVIDFM